MCIISLCIWVCVWERETQRERVCVCVCVCERERVERESESVCVCERERKRERVCVCEREKERESLCVCRECGCLCMCACMCDWEMGSGGGASERASSAFLYCNRQQASINKRHTKEEGQINISSSSSNSLRQTHGNIRRTTPGLHQKKQAPYRFSVLKTCRRQLSPFCATRFLQRWSHLQRELHSTTLQAQKARIQWLIFDQGRVLLWQ